jgi:excisionase family DNA binding protein
MQESHTLLSQVLTAREVARLFGVSTGQVRMAIYRGTIPARKTGDGSHDPWLLVRADCEARWGAGFKRRKGGETRER